MWLLIVTIVYYHKRKLFWYITNLRFILTSCCMQYAYTVPFMINKIPDSALENPKTRVVQGLQCSKCLLIWENGGKNLQSGPFTSYTAHMHAFIFKNKLQLQSMYPLEKIFYCIDVVSTIFFKISKVSVLFSWSFWLKFTFPGRIRH